MRKNLTLATILLVALAASSTISTTTASPDDHPSQEYPPYRLYFPNTDNRTGAAAVVNDDLFGNGAPIRACFAPETALTCTEVDEDAKFWCGNLIKISSSVPPGLLVEVRPFHLNDDLTVCGATTGSVSISWF